jgi:hypothetical protein
MVVIHSWKWRVQRHPDIELLVGKPKTLKLEWGRWFKDESTPFQIWDILKGLSDLLAGVLI